MIVVTTTPELGRLLHQHGAVERIPDDERYRALQQGLQERGCRLTPLFPDTTEESLLTWFELRGTLKGVPAELDALLQLPGIEGAYEKPADDLPQ